MKSLFLANRLLRRWNAPRRWLSLARSPTPIASAFNQLPSEHNVKQREAALSANLLYDLITLPMQSPAVAARRRALAVTSAAAYWREQAAAARDDVGTHTFLIRAMTEQRRFDEARRAYEEALERFGATQSAAVAGDEAAAAIASSSSSSSSSSSPPSSSLIHLPQESRERNSVFIAAAMCEAIAGEFEAVDALLRRWRPSTAAARRYATTARVVAAGASYQPDIATKLMQEASDEDCEDIVLQTAYLNALIDCNRLTEAWSRFKLLRTTRSSPPDAVTMTTMLRACAANQETEKALNLYEEMLQIGMQPTEVTMAAVLHACSVRRRYAPTALALFNRMQVSGFSPTLECYEAVLNALARLGDDREALRVLRRLETDEAVAAPASAAAVAATLRALARAQLTDPAGSSRRIDEAERLFAAFCSPAPPQPMPLLLLNSLLLVYTMALRLNRAEELVQQRFASFNVEPDAITATYMIRMYGQARRTKRALEVFESLQCEPLPATYAAILHACARGYYIRSGLRILQRMPVKPEFKQVLPLYRAARRVNHALAAEVRRMCSHNVI